MTEQKYSENANLIRDLKKRSPEAIRELWSRYEHKLYNSCTHILGAGPNAKDVTWDVLVEFLGKYVETLAKPDALSAFLHIMAVRRSLRLRKNLQRYDVFDNTFTDEELLKLESDTPEAQIELNRLLTQLNKCFSKLSPKTRQAIRLKFQHELSHADIASTMGVSKTIIGRLTQKGLDLLRRCILSRLNEARKIKGEKFGPCSIETDKIVRLLALQQTNRQIDICDHSEAAAVYLTSRIEGNSLAVKSMPEICDECKSAIRVIEKELHINNIFKTNIASKKTKSNTSVSVWKATAIAAGFAATFFTGVVVNEQLRAKSEGQYTETLRIKGIADRIGVTVRRGNEMFDLLPMGKLLENDQISLRYSAETTGYLIVLNLDEQKNAATLYPKPNTTVIKTEKGIDLQLNAGGIVKSGKGCEWIVGIFSDSPLNIEYIVNTVKQAKLTLADDRCNLKLDLPEARTISIIPIIR